MLNGHERYILCRKYLHAYISCANLSNQMDRPNDDLTGRKFGKLVVLPRHDSDLSDRPGEWLVQCECGRLRLVPGRDLLTGRSSSCGCIPVRKNGHNEKTSVRGSALRTRLERVMNELPPQGTAHRRKSEGAQESGLIDEDTPSDWRMIV
jgi:hypothetical protein